MALETRSNSALLERAEQVKRWRDSLIWMEPEGWRRSNRRIRFSDSCVFLAACGAGDIEEVLQLLEDGADIDTCNVDGLTGLHQACIDNNLEMVELLVRNGADVNRGDNEGWTPLHATASCGFLSIAQFLLEHGSDVGAVNNDGELAIDISESDEMEQLLHNEIQARNVNCELARNKEEQCMLEDARVWKSIGKINEQPHNKTGATALHVAAAKGYIQVIHLLLQAGCDVNKQDYDGWTPLHAAAHWAQLEACKLLVESSVNKEIENFVGQTPYDVADPELLPFLEKLCNKKNKLIKVYTDIDISSCPTNIGSCPTNIGSCPAIISSCATSLTSCSTNLSNGSANIPDPIQGEKETRRSSVTRLSRQEKLQSTKQSTAKDVFKEEMIPRSIDQDNPGCNRKSDKELFQSVCGSKTLVSSEVRKETMTSFLSPLSEANQQGRNERAVPWRRSSSLRIRSTNGSAVNNLKLALSDENPISLSRAHSFGSDKKFYAKLAELKQRIQENSKSVPILNKVESDEIAPLVCSSSAPETPRPESPTTNSLSKLPYSSKQGSAPIGMELQPLLEQQVERLPLTLLPSPSSFFNHTITTKEFHKSGLRKEVSEDSDLLLRRLKNVSAAKTVTGAVLTEPVHVRRSVVPPVRDEEHEIQRKAHAKRVRETRRSTQGITLEDLNSAEQIVKRKQQQENATRTLELKQLASGSSLTGRVIEHGRESSQKLREESSSRSRLSLEDATRNDDLTKSSSNINMKVESSLHLTTYSDIDKQQIPKLSQDKCKEVQESSAIGSTVLDMSTEVSSAGSVVMRSSQCSKEYNSSPIQRKLPIETKSVVNGGEKVDYRKLWEESQAENVKLRIEVNDIRSELDFTRKQLDSIESLNDGDMGRRENQMLQKKLGEVEEELKILNNIQADNERLKDENRALIRVVSKLSK